jgi:hypothetical protein
VSAVIINRDFVDPEKFLALDGSDEGPNGRLGRGVKVHEKREAG